VDLVIVVVRREPLILIEVILYAAGQIELGVIGRFRPMAFRHTTVRRPTGDADSLSIVSIEMESDNALVLGVPDGVGGSPDNETPLVFDQDRFGPEIDRLILETQSSAINDVDKTEW